MVDYHASSADLNRIRRQYLWSYVVRCAQLALEKCGQAFTARWPCSHCHARRRCSQHLMVGVIYAFRGLCRGLRTTRSYAQRINSTASPTREDTRAHSPGHDTAACQTSACKHLVCADLNVTALKVWRQGDTPSSRDCCGATNPRMRDLGAHLCESAGHEAGN